MVSRPPEPIPDEIEPEGDDLPSPPDEGDLPLPIPGDDEIPSALVGGIGGSARGDAKLRNAL